MSLWEGERRNLQGLFEMSVLTAIQLSMRFFLFFWLLSQSSISSLPHACTWNPNVSAFHVCLCHTLFWMRLILLPAHRWCDRSAFVCLWVTYSLSMKRLWMIFAPYLCAIECSHACVYVCVCARARKHATDACVNPNSLTSSYIFAMVVLIVWALTAPMADSWVQCST